MKPLVIIFGLIILCTSMLLQYSALHNIDLSWNARYVNLVDDNGIVSQDMITMYNNGYRTLWITPLTIMLGISLIFGGIFQ